VITSVDYYLERLDRRRRERIVTIFSRWQPNAMHTLGYDLGGGGGAAQV